MPEFKPTVSKLVSEQCRLISLLTTLVNRLIDSFVYVCAPTGYRAGFVSGALLVCLND